MPPAVLGQIRALIGKRRVTVVIDRGGFSPKLLVRLIDQGFAVLTGRKGRCPRVPRKRFRQPVGIPTSGSS